MGKDKPAEKQLEVVRAELAAWSGVYSTDTKWWGQYFSPLIIDSAGAGVTLAGRVLDFSFENGELSFGRQPIKGTTARGRSIRFHKDPDGRKSFAGSIYPRPQDGPVEFSGSQLKDPRDTYLVARKTLMGEFFDPFVNADLLNEIGWSEADAKAAALLEKHKKAVSSQPGYYGAPWEATWFLDVRDKIAGTELFTMLQAMPKGAILHVHPTAMGDYEALLEDAAGYESGREKFFVSSDRACEPGDLFKLATQAPAGYRPLSQEMNDPGSRREVLGKLQLTSEDKDYKGDIWELFEPVFARVSPLLKPVELERGYYERAFRYLVEEDHVSHVELRTSWDPANETRQDSKEQVILGAIRGLDLTLKAIWSDSRGLKTDPTRITEDVVKVGQILKKDPEGVLIGYDLVGEEDTGRTTYYFLDAVLEAYEKLGEWLPPMFFHDGESALPPDYAAADIGLQGTPSQDWFNNNLVDAYLMNSLALSRFQFQTARVGHGLELFKTPGLARRYQEAGICIELCPVSNQLLRYMLDLREHPGQAYLARGIPVSINPDDPAIYGYQGVTHDFWEACMAWGLDLSALKVLAYYSLKHSGLGESAKATRIAAWREDWERFVKVVPGS